MAIFNSYVKLPEGRYPLFFHYNFPSENHFQHSEKNWPIGPWRDHVQQKVDFEGHPKWAVWNKSLYHSIESWLVYRDSPIGLL